MKKLMPIIVLFLLLLPTAISLGELLGSCDFTTSCEGAGVIKIVNDTGKCTEDVGNGTLYCKNSGFTDPAKVNFTIESGFDFQIMTNETITVIIDYRVDTQDATASFGMPLMSCGIPTDVDNSWCGHGRSAGTYSPEQIGDSGTGFVTVNVGKAGFPDFIRVAWEYNSSDGNLTFYNESVRDGGVYTHIASRLSAHADKQLTQIQLFDPRVGGSYYADLWIKDIKVYNGSIDDISAAAADEFAVTAVDAYDGSTINSYTVTLKNSTDTYINSTTTGSITWDNLSTSALFDVSINSTENGGYFNKTFVGVNTSGDYIGHIYQALLFLNVSEIITNTKLIDFYGIAPSYSNKSNSTGWAVIPIKNGTYNISANATGYIEWWQTITVDNSQEKYINISLGKGNLTVRAKSAVTGEFIANFTITMWYEDILAYNYNISKETKNQSVIGSHNSTLRFRVIPGNFNLSIDAPGYSLEEADIVIATGNLMPNYTFTLATTNSVNFTIYDELTNDKLNGTVWIDIIGTPFSKNYSTTNATLYVDLLEPADYRIRYYSAKFTERDYYIAVTNRSNQSVTLYLLSTGNSTDTTITVEDENINGVINATIKMLRYYTSSNSYVIVAMAKTDESGEAKINVDNYDGYYYFIIESASGSNLLTTSPFRIIETELTFRVTIEESVLISRRGLHKIATDLIFDNLTDIVRFTYSDSGNLLSQACLIVDRITIAGKAEICNNCSTSLSGTLLCYVNTSIAGQYIAKGRIETSTENSEYYEKVISFLSRSAKDAVNKFGDLGPYLAAYGIMFMALLGTPFPPLSILLVMVGLVFASIMGILGISYVALAAIIILGAIIMFKVRQ